MCLDAVFSLFFRPRSLRLTLFPYTTLFRSLRLLRSGRVRPERLRAHMVWDKGRAPGAHPDSARSFHERDRRYRYQRSEEHTSELQSREKLVCRLLLEKKNNTS